MENNTDIFTVGYQHLVSQISETYSSGYRKTVAAVNANRIEPIGK